MNMVNLLDSGYVKLLNISGPVRRPEDDFDANDIDPASVARVSFDNKKCKSKDEDLRLCEYLIKNSHMGPFEMIEVWLEIKLPIFLARQFMRHRTASVNEVSGRYATFDEDWYVPTLFFTESVEFVKQGGRVCEDKETIDWYFKNLHEDCKKAYNLYLMAIELGIAKQHARLFLHVNHYTRIVWKQDLRNLMHFLKLRLDDSAQIEAQIYAHAIKDLLKKHIPNLISLFEKYVETK